MKARSLLAPFAFLAFGFALAVFAADKPAAKGGYTVVLEMKVDETGTVEDAKIFSSEDATFDRVLERNAFDQARKMKLAVQKQGDKPVKYTVRAPFLFPIEGDQGPESNNIPKPKIHSAVKPTYPPELAAKGEPGGVILDLVVDAAGNVAQLKVLRSSRPEFAQATESAVKQWKFAPAEQNGAPVESHFHMAVTFMTDVSAPEWKWRFAPRPSIGNYTVMYRTEVDNKPAAPETPATPPVGK